ncbi:hypothetical protein [Sphingomicrobium aestuariivivum]|uniref:hypothetical protein n=1 Tax=Sphingomicrobium aestuariivivum TaxID=1582356 RepID=UPI001FD71970|nr:hypothetical protein [Sphingomicrobium aestuariivivum]MCJ8190686.1 hypothetical protein [Sphingomicrobium aestuariivivum]
MDMDLPRLPSHDSTSLTPRHDAVRADEHREAAQRGACAAAEWRWFWRHYGWKQHD